MESLKVYYSDYPRDQHVPSQEPTSLDLYGILAFYEAFSKDTSCFMGIEDFHNQAVQFYWDSPTQVLVDVPKMAENATYNLTVEPSLIPTLIKEVYAGKNILTECGLEFEKETF